MRNTINIFFLIFIFKIGNSQELQIPPNRIQDIEIDDNLQNSSIRDSIMSKFGNRSTKLNKNPDAKIQDYLIITRYHDTIIVDTSLTIEKYHKINYLRRDNFDLIPFSNTGVAYNTLSFSGINTIAPKMGASNKYYTYESADDVVYYDLPTPFTELMYRSVFEQGQMLDAIYSVNTSRQFNFSISRKGLRSIGNYQNFISNSSNFKFTTNYLSKNNKYRLRSHYSNQKLFSEQNGGITNSDILNFENGNSQFLDRGVFDPNFENAHNEFLGKRFFIDQSYVLRQRDSVKNSNINLYNSISLEEKKYKFQQTSSDQFFGESFNNQEINDKILLNSLNINTGLTYNSENLGKIKLGLRYSGDKYSLENFQIEQYIDISQTINSKTTFLIAEYSNEFSKIHLHAKTESFIFGDNKSNLYTSTIKFRLKNSNSLAINYKLLSSTPNYNFLLYRSNYENYNWNNQFDNSTTNSISFDLEFDKLFEMKVGLISVKKHLQFEKTTDGLPDSSEYSIIPVQHNENLDVFKIQLDRETNFGKFSIDTRFLFQKSLSNEIIHIPQIVSRNTIYYTTHMFRKALFLQTGFGVKYFSKFYMNGYDPLLSELYVQNEKKIGEFPIIDFFINAKIQQTRLYFKFEHFNSSFTGYNYYSAPNYPYRDFTFRFGLVWNFFM
tara:strand:+ start:37 stop:2031 length:1995 start_codon:yes stop_codon:yes gene_type:complete